MDETVLLGHGSGGTMMKRIIDEVFYEAYGSTELLEGNDAACLEAPQAGERLAYSTDSFVVLLIFSLVVISENLRYAAR